MIFNTEIFFDYGTLTQVSISVLGLGQIVATILVLHFGKLFKIISFPDLSRDTLRKVIYFIVKSGNIAVLQHFKSIY